MQIQIPEKRFAIEKVSHCAFYTLVPKIENLVSGTRTLGIVAPSPARFPLGFVSFRMIFPCLGEILALVQPYGEIHAAMHLRSYKV